MSVDPPRVCFVSNILIRLRLGSDLRLEGPGLLGPRSLLLLSLYYIGRVKGFIGFGAGLTLFKRRFGLAVQGALVENPAVRV